MQSAMQASKISRKLAGLANWTAQVPARMAAPMVSAGALNE